MKSVLVVALTVVLAATACSSPPPQEEVIANPNQVYLNCLLAAGLDPGGVQVITASQVDSPVGGSQPSSTPLAVKTGLEVPAAIHGPCFERIGGSANGLSSWSR